MKAEQKAEELINKCVGYAYDGMSSAEDNAVKIALITVDEIQKVLMSDELYNPNHLGFERVDNYWEDVKKILEQK